MRGYCDCIGLGDVGTGEAASGLWRSCFSVLWEREREKGDGASCSPCFLFLASCLFLVSLNNSCLLGRGASRNRSN